MDRRDILKSTALLGAFAGAGCTATGKSRSRIISNPYTLRDDFKEAPFGGEVSADIVNYTRAAPYVGTAGTLKGDGVEEAQRHGFALVVDLRRPEEEGVMEEQALAKRIGLNYMNVPLSSDERAWDQVAAVAAALDDPNNYPVLIHCQSANRAGALWTLYRTRQGIPPIAAIEEGRAIGLKSREISVRNLLGLRPI